MNIFNIFNEVIDMSGIDMSGIDMSGIDMGGIGMSGIGMSGISMSRMGFNMDLEEDISQNQTRLNRILEISNDRQLFGNFLLNNQDNPDIFNSSLHQENVYKEVISEEGKKLLKKEIYTKGICLNEDCPITQETFNDEYEITILPCAHGFTTSAIEKWLETQCPECPICRFKLDSTEIRNNEYEEIEQGQGQGQGQIPLQTSRYNFLESLNSLTNIIHPFGRQQMINTIPHSYIRNMFRTEETEETDLNEAIINSLQDIQENKKIQEIQEIQEIQDISGN